MVLCATESACGGEDAWSSVGWRQAAFADAFLRRRWGFRLGENWVLQVGEAQDKSAVEDFVVKSFVRNPGNAGPAGGENLNNRDRGELQEIDEPLVHEEPDSC